MNVKEEKNMDLRPITRKEWADALRSGKYQQARGRLRDARGKRKDGPAFCCLGVALDLAGFKWGSRAGVNRLASAYAHIMVDDRPLTYDEEGLLADANDGGCSFLWIADMIEAGGEDA